MPERLHALSNDRLTSAQDPGAGSRSLRGDFADVKSIRSEGAEPIPVRAGTHRMGTIIVRFVTILVLVIVVLMLVWYR
jgi:hypothetical protein